jgi:ribonuclease HII
MEKLFPTDSLDRLIPAPVGPYQPDLELENRLFNDGYKFVAGIDEAGRGPLAGPVVSAAVILDFEALPVGLGDSKTLSASRRNELYDEILESSHVAVSTINAGTIDVINIRQATLKSMRQAARALATKPGWCLIDGRDIPLDMGCKATAVIKGDGRSMSIAAASIVAKVVRDRIMVEAANSHPDYGFEKHKGYGTRAHRLAIANQGPCRIHRFSFAPISKK